VATERPRCGASLVARSDRFYLEGMHRPGAPARLDTSSRRDREAGMTTTLLEVPGIGADRAAALAENGIRSIEQLAGAAVADIAAVPGFGPVTARRSRQNAQELLLSRPERDEKDEKPGKKDKGKSGKGKKGKGKKGRKKDRKRRDRGKGKGKKSKKHDKKRKKKEKKKRKGS
jgi:hypothetical protein